MPEEGSRNDPPPHRTDPQQTGPGLRAPGSRAAFPHHDLVLQTWALMSSTTVLSFPLTMPFLLPLFPTLRSLQGSVLGSLPFFTLQFLPQNSCFLSWVQLSSLQMALRPNLPGLQVFICVSGHHLKQPLHLPTQPGLTYLFLLMAHDVFQASDL